MSATVSEVTVVSSTGLSDVRHDQISKVVLLAPPPCHPKEDHAKWLSAQHTPCCDDADIEEYIDSPGLIRQGFFIGSRETEACLPALQRAGITHILQAGGELRPSHPGRFRYKHLSLGDEEDEDLVSVFDDAFTFIDEGRKAGVLRLHLHLHLQQQQQQQQ
jgi:hypothetical protein